MSKDHCRTQEIIGTLQAESNPGKLGHVRNLLLHGLMQDNTTGMRLDAVVEKRTSDAAILWRFEWLPSGSRNMIAVEKFRSPLKPSGSAAWLSFPSSLDASSISLIDQGCVAA